ncbi:MAG: hypothetical protein IJJ88_06415, partial [Oscillospiraceae bacterium]|nr:hypothetical protein [Oscillospiraceae bacterium]
VLILLLIGVLVGVWIAAGTVPAMVVYGLRLISPRLFLTSAMLVCALLSMALGSWGTAGTVGIAFMGMARAMGVPLPMAAGAVISGAYVGDKLSPLADSTVLAAAMAEIDVFASIRNIAKVALPTFAVCLGAYGVLGWRYGGGVAADSVSAMSDALQSAFRLGLPAFLPLLVLVGCILCKIPAIPSLFLGCVTGGVYAVAVQGTSAAEVMGCAFGGYVGQTGVAMVDQLLTAGGLSSMLYSVSIVVLAMAFGGIMEKTGQMEVLLSPIVRRLRGFVPLMACTVATCGVVNVVLPDQYIGIALPGRMYAAAFDRAGMERRDLSLAIGVGGALTSALVPWNTCGIYMAGVLGVATAEYLPYALYNLAMPVAAIVYAALRQAKR